MSLTQISIKDIFICLDALFKLRLFFLVLFICLYFFLNLSSLRQIYMF